MNIVDWISVLSSLFRARSLALSLIGLVVYFCTSALALRSTVHLIALDPWSQKELESLELIHVFPLPELK